MKIIDKNQSQLNQPICIGTGLVALDVIINSVTKSNSLFLAGGSCGNVLTILSYLGWTSYPIARLSKNSATELILEDFQRWKVKPNLLQIEDSGSTPIIIHRIMKDKSGKTKHRFEFKNPEDGKYLPSYKPCLAKNVPAIVANSSAPNIFYLDRISRSSIDLAKQYKALGAIIFFEPTSIKDVKGFDECINLADIVKFSNERIDRFHEHYPYPIAPLEIVTLGDEGLKLRTRSKYQWRHVQGYNIEKTIDSAGAGDWCSAGFIFSLFPNYKNIELISEDDLINSLKFGQVLSALNCMYEGARGLMYEIDKETLLNQVNFILSQDNSNITSPSTKGYKRIREKDISISSLFK